MRTIIKTIFFAPALVLASACSKDQPADTSLNNDLSLAAQVSPGMRMDSIGALERTNGGVTPAGYPANSLRPDGTPAVAPAPAPVRRSTASAPARRRSTSSTGSSSGTRSTSSGTTVAAEPRVIVKKNTKRDAAIGAAAGAIIGAAASKDRVKGGLIGAAAGGILGGVIGNNVDIEKKRVP